MEKSIDNELYELFLQESQDLFEALNKDLVSLENNPSDERTLYSILRAVHSLKGSAGMLHFKLLQKLCHRFEDFMEVLHSHPEAVSREIMDLLFIGCDTIQSLFNRSVDSGGDGGEFSPKERGFLDNLEARQRVVEFGGLTLESVVGGLLARVDELVGVIGDVCDVSTLVREAAAVKEMLGRAERAAGAQTEGEGGVFVGGRDIRAQLDSMAHLAAAAESGAIGGGDVEKFFAELEVVLAAVAASDDEELHALAEEARGNMSIFHELELDFDALQSELYTQFIGQLRARADAVPSSTQPELDDEGDDDASDATAGSPAVPATTSKSLGGVAAMAKATVRIEETKIDAFLDNVGEMIILGEVFNNLQKRLKSLASGDAGLLNEFRNANKSFSNHVFSLQKALMDVRRVELRNITGSLARLARDTAVKLGKSIRVDIVGEEAVIDKSHLEDVKTALIHLVRNCVDHGIEQPDARAAAGKSAQGRLAIEASNEMDFLIIRISDDGRGIDSEIIRRESVRRGVATAAELDAMSRDEILRMVLADGFSTAAEVSDVSGRGVGMSVVGANIARMGGTVELRSEVGVGTSITMRIPLSVMLSVTDAFIVRIGAERFAMPIKQLVESFNLEASRLVSLVGRGECVMFRGKLYRLCRLSRVFAVPDAAESGGICILVNTEREIFCLHVDDIVDHQQIVIKDIHGLGGLPGVLGGTLLGDGSVGIVLDIDHFALR